MSNLISEVASATVEQTIEDRYNIFKIHVKGVNALVREDTSDEFVVNEVIKGNEYRKLKLRTDDIVLDFGLNIGMFTIQSSKRGVAEIHSFEPDKDNFYLATKNCELNDIVLGEQVFLYNDAVVGNDDAERNFSINVKRNKGAHSLVEKRGRDTVTVTAKNINTIIEEINPTVIKMDIEGGEYEVLPAIKDWSNIREFIMEFHHAHLNDIKTKEKYGEMITLLKSKFKNVVYRKETKKAWVSIVYCTQEEIVV
jgi:FkbM family methyltransferase